MKSSGIKKKGRIGQFFCKHENTGWYSKNTKFQAISGETRYQICEDCGKEVGKQFHEYEGMGFK